MFASEGDSVNVGRLGTTAHAERWDEGRGARPSGGDEATAWMARRLQGRLDRQQWLLDQHLHAQPSVVPELLELNRRMRRDTEVLQMLGGEEPGLRPTAPRRLSDTLTEAVSGADEPSRIAVRSAPAASIAPAASVEFAHVLSAALDHVTLAYPDARVDLTARVEALGGITVDVAVDGALRHDPDGPDGRGTRLVAEQLSTRARTGVELGRPLGPPPATSGLVLSVHCPAAEVSVDEPVWPSPSTSGGFRVRTHSTGATPAVRTNGFGHTPDQSGGFYGDDGPVGSGTGGFRATGPGESTGSGRAAAYDDGYRSDRSPDHRGEYAFDARAGDYRGEYGRDHDGDHGGDYGRTDLGGPSYADDPLGIGSYRSRPPEEPAGADGGYPGSGYTDIGYPGNGYPDPGYGDTGYRENGYRDNGYPASGYPDTGYPGNGYPGNGYPDNGYGQGGYGGNGYQNGNGYPANGYPANGAPANGNGADQFAASSLTGPSLPTYQPSRSSQVDELFGPIIDLPIEPMDDRFATPIFEAIASAWFRDEPEEAPEGRRHDSLDWESPNDAEWRAAAERAASIPTAESLTATGLPRRRPGGQLVPPPLSRRPAPATGPAERVPDRVRDRLSTYQRGLRQGRHRAPRGALGVRRVVS
jgi:hypothetical protein